MKLKFRNSIEFIIAALRERARTFTELQRDDGKVIKLLDCVVDFLLALSTLARFFKISV